MTAHRTPIHLMNDFLSGQRQKWDIDMGAPEKKP